MENNTIALSAVEEKMLGLRETTAQTKVESDEDLKAVAEKLKKIKTVAKFIRAEMERYTKPAQEIINNARRIFLPYEKECEIAEENLKAKAGAYMEKVEAERQRKEDAIGKKLEAGRLKDETAIQKLDELGDEKKTVASGDAILQKRTVREVVIVKPELVPDEYWVIDEKKVKKIALAGVEIPGVEIREVSQIAIK